MAKECKRKWKADKDSAKHAIQRAKAYVLYTIDYNDDLHIGSDTGRITGTKDVKQESVLVMENYAHKLLFAALTRDKLTEESKKQSKRVLDAKEARSLELSNEKI